MRKKLVGIDISKENLNVCLMEDMRPIQEEKLENTVKAIQKWIQKMKKTALFTADDVLLCAEFTGRYIYTFYLPGRQ